MRPYLRAASAANMLLSQVYVSRLTGMPCISAVQCIQHGPRTLGYLAADFSLSDLSLSGDAAMQPRAWLQIKGDPAIRQGLFNQCRAESDMDRSIDSVLDIVDMLMRERGIFHAKLHFSSSRATLWLYSDPHRYRVLSVDELLTATPCPTCPSTHYPLDAVVEPQRIREILELFRTLRFSDEQFYLRSGSLNLINGLVGLNFSCDGSHYLPADEFLASPLARWFSK